MNNNSKSNEIIESAACLLLSVAEADEILEPKEFETIADILSDFFEINSNFAKSILENAKIKLQQSIGLFEYGQILNTQLGYQDKVDFICCVFEVAYADGDLHYLEHHTIRKIAHIMNIEHVDLVNSKSEIETYLQ
jgi:uncharacterized tellurite resistance protein B-like protein